MVIANRSTLFIVLVLTSWRDKFITMIKNRTVQYDAWFVILLAVLLVLAFTIASALAIWCVVVKGGSFTGDWQWSKWGVSVKANCAV